MAPRGSKETGCCWPKNRLAEELDRLDTRISPKPATGYSRAMSMAGGMDFLMQEFKPRGQYPVALSRRSTPHTRPVDPECLYRAVCASRCQELSNDSGHIKSAAPFKSITFGQSNAYSAPRLRQPGFCPLSSARDRVIRHADPAILVAWQVYEPDQ